MKNIFKINKAAKPYIIINALVFAIVGALVGKTYVNIKNTKNKISHDEEVFKDFLKHMTETCPNKVSLKDLENGMCEEDDPKDPMDPTVIYVYN